MVDIEEGEVLNSILYRKFVKENKNFLGVVVGQTGSGKSWLCLRICELWYKKRFKTEFPIINVGWNPSDIMERIVHGEIPQGSLLVLEEGGVSMSSLEFQNKIAKLFNYILQSFRSKNIGLLINLPNYIMLNKQTRMLMHMLFQIEFLDKDKEKVIISPYHLQYNQQTGKLYRHKPKIVVDGVKEKVQFLTYSKPSQKLVDEYEKQKAEFVSSLSKDVLKDIKDYMLNKKPLTVLQTKVIMCWEEGIFEQTEIAIRMKKDQSQVSRIETSLGNKGFFKEEYIKEWEKKHKNLGK